MPPYVLDKSRLSSSTILGSHTTVLPYSSLCYYPVSLTKIPLNVLETYANTAFALYAIRTYRYCMYSTGIYYMLLLPFDHLPPRSMRFSNSGI